MNERVFPNLGLVQLATSLKERGYNLELLDLCGNNNSNQLIQEIAHSADLFGFSSTTPQFIETYKLNSLLKKENPNAKTILGGAHPSAMHSLLKSGRVEDINLQRLNSFDYIFVGEGDESDFNNLKPGWNIAPLIHDIDKSPIPDRSLIDIHSYKYFLNGKETTILMTQRGCPFNCSFCCGRDVEMYRKPRSKSPKRILEELDYLNDKFGYSSFMWFDDEINVNSKRLKDISELLKKRNYIHRGFVRSDLLVKHPETLEYLIDSGFVELCSGVESGSDDVLKRINKGTTSEINSLAAHIIMDKGIKYKAFAMMGHPGETYEEFKKTVQWIKDIKPHGFDISILSPYPGSRLYNLAKDSNKYPEFDREYEGLYFKSIDYSSEESFYKGKPGEYHCNIRTDELTSENLLQLRDNTEKELKRS